MVAGNRYVDESADEHGEVGDDESNKHVDEQLCHLDPCVTKIT